MKVIGHSKTYSGEITISYPWELPNKIRGPAVMFDVVAASHNISYLVRNVDALYVVTQDTVHFALEELPHAVLVGESDDPALQDKFVASNSASIIAHTDLKGKKVILLTYNGTYTLHEIWDKGARPVIIADYANLHTVVKWLQMQEGDTESITLVPSGGREKEHSSHPNLLEDLLCAKAAEELLQGKTANLQKDFAKSRNFINQNYPQYWPTKDADLDLIFTAFDIYPVVPACEKLQNGLLKVTDISI